MSRLLLDAILFVSVTVGYVAWRAPGDLVWDDSPAVVDNVAAGLNLSFDHVGERQFWRTVCVAPFRAVYGDGYRPLNTALSRLGTAYCGASPRAPTGLLILNGIVLGLLAVTYYRLARRFTRTSAAAGFSVFLLLASTPVLTASLVLFRGVQALVPLTICCALQCYYAARESHRPWAWLLILAVLMLLGPWYREFIGVVPILILFLELQAGRWRSPLALLATCGLLHALFPTALLHLVVFRGLPVRPVFLLGSLGAQLRAGVTSGSSLLGKFGDVLALLKWRVLLDLVSILPPTLFLLAAAGWLVAALRRHASPVSPRHAAFLGVFFLLTFVPFFKVFKLHVHLAYCLVPASILLAASIESLWMAARQRRGTALLCGALLLIVVADHALNLFVVRGANLCCDAAVHRVAGFCQREMPSGSTLLTNAHHSYDIRLCCQSRFPCYFATITGSSKALFVTNPVGLAALLAKVGDGDLYCLDARLPHPTGQLGWNRAHWVMRDEPVEMLDYGEIDRVSYKYPVLDPLKLLLPTRNMTWPCSPDLEFDYYRGPALDGSPWLREVAVSYHFAKVIGREVRDLNDSATEMANKRPQDREATFK